MATDQQAGQDMIGDAAEAGSTLVVGGRSIAIERRPGGEPGLFWLGGFRSDMAGTKALAVDRFGAARGLAVTRFDYSGHGRSDGTYTDGTISQWLEEALAVFALTSGPQVVIGSSMGGWLALLLNRALRARGEARIKAMVLIAPATDMTEDLMRATFSRRQLKALETAGHVDEPSDYGEPYRLTRALIEDGARHLMFGGPIETGCPVTILQGGRDTDVPREHAMKLMAHIVSDPVSLSLIPDGDHRLSREADIAVLEAALARAVAGES